MTERDSSGQGSKMPLEKYLDRTDLPDPLLVAASVAEAGWPVIPIWPRTKKPVGAGGTQHHQIWLLDAKSVVDRGEWFRDEEAQWPGWAVVLGEPNRDGLRLIALDTDDPAAEQRLTGMIRASDEARTWAEQTLTVTTPRGVHRYGTTRARIGTGKPWENFDFKASGYIVLPGARHAEGSLYVDSSPMGARLASDTQPPLAFFRGFSPNYDRRYWSRVLTLPAGFLAALTADIPDDAVEDEYGEARLYRRADRVESGAFARLLAEFEALGRKIRRTGPGQAMVSCPGPSHAHGDRNPSLSVTGVEGKVLLKCFSGCETEQIVAAIGWSMPDLFDATDEITIEIAEEPPVETTPERPGEMIGRFRVYDRAAIEAMPEPDEILEGVIGARGSTMMLAGARGIGKSFLALDLAASISTPSVETWNGHQVRHHGGVVYVALEGFHAVKRRVQAWERYHGAPRGSLTRIKFITDNEGPIDLKRPADQVDLAMVIEELNSRAETDDDRILMVVIDSARAAGAGKEDTEDMGLFTKGVEALRNRTQVLPLVVHNSGWLTTRERGSTVLGDAMDTNLIMERRDDDLRVLNHEKHRDGNKLKGLTLAFRQVDLGMSEWGLPAESGVLVPTTSVVESKGTTTWTTRDEVLDKAQEKAAKRARKRISDQLHDQIVDEAFGDGGTDWRTLEEIKDDISLSDEDYGRRTLTNVMGLLVKERYLERRGEGPGVRYRAIPASQDEE